MPAPLRSSASLEEARPLHAPCVTARLLPRPAVAPVEPGAGTVYARLGRPLLRAGLLAVCLPGALVVGLPVLLVNAVQFGGLGRVFFRQSRVGLDGRVFRIVKFRTMHGDDGDCDAWRQGEDGTRVTAFGRFLRRTHLDELPQLWNILRGEMDFIGPRPEMVAIDAWARARIPRFRERNAVRPGVTGLAQVLLGYTPREVAAYRQKLQLDLAGMARSSLALDLEILGRTMLAMLFARGWRPARGRFDP